MRTPQGFECRYFYGNYYRGKNQEECRLWEDKDLPAEWSSSLCKSCPIPGIQRANACPNMELRPQIKSYLLGFKKLMSVNAYCTKSDQVVSEPEIGCGQCHPLPDIFSKKL